MVLPFSSVPHTSKLMYPPGEAKPLKEKKILQNGAFFSMCVELIDSGQQVRETCGDLFLKQITHGEKN